MKKGKKTKIVKVKTKRGDEIFAAAQAEVDQDGYKRAYETMRHLLSKLKEAQKVVKNYEGDIERLKKKINEGTFTDQTHL